MEGAKKDAAAIPKPKKINIEPFLTSIKNFKSFLKALFRLFSFLVIFYLQEESSRDSFNKFRNNTYRNLNKLRIKTTICFSKCLFHFAGLLKLLYLCKMEKSLSKIFGLRAVIEAIQSGQTIEKAFIQKGLSGGDLYNEFISLVKENNIATSSVPVEKLDRLSKNQNHQGVVAQISPVEYHDAETLIDEICGKKEKPLFLILDHITDVRNYGSIIRTAECTGVDAIIVPKAGSASLNADAIKTSAGAAFKIPICKVDHIKDAVYIMQSYEIHTVAATEKTEDTVYAMEFNQGVAIIMGAEDRGVNPSVLKVVDGKAKLPLLGEIASLNVSVACGAFLYEAVRQRSI